MKRWACVALTVLSAVAASGCSSTSTCNRDPDSTQVCNGQGKSAQNFWFSSAYHDPAKSLSSGETGYQYFPPARTITFQHNLGSVPFPVITLAFDDNGSIAPTAGNQAIVECMDDNVIQIKNDTCSDFYIWLQVEGTGVPAEHTCKNPSSFDVCAGASDESGGAGGAP